MTTTTLSPLCALCESEIGSWVLGDERLIGSGCLMRGLAVKSYPEGMRDWHPGYVCQGECPEHRRCHVVPVDACPGCREEARGSA